MRMHRGVALAVLATALLTGCGDDDKGTGGPKADQGGPRLTKAEFVTQANKICSDQLDADDSAVDTSDAASLQKYLNASLDAADQVLVKLRALRPPADQEAAFTSTLNTAKAMSDGVRPKIKDVNSVADVEKLDLEKAEAAINKGFDDLGLTDCGSDS